LTCTSILKSGPKKGTMCGKKNVTGKSGCVLHSK
jgi:hypothetical protein